MLRSAPAQVSLGTGDGQSLVRPPSLSFGGDGSFYLTELIWSSWRPATASAFGTAHQNDCKPFCANGLCRLLQEVEGFPRIAVSWGRPSVSRWRFLRHNFVRGR